MFDEAPMTNEALREIAPSGPLRTAIALSPATSPFFATVDAASGEPRGVTISLAKELAASLGLKLEFVIYPNSGQITDRANDSEWDVTFMPADAERAKRVAFGPPYALVESTYLVAAGTKARDMAELDTAKTRVIVIANTATGRSAARTLKTAALIESSSVEDAFEMLRSGRGDAIGLSRDALATLALKLPDARLLEGRFHAAGVAVAVPMGRPAALSLVSDFIETAKASGSVRRALDAAGLKYAVVAPPGAAI
jgi:polar amino acid transport system substrate-binding protein